MSVTCEAMVPDWMPPPLLLAIVAASSVTPLPPIQRPPPPVPALLPLRVRLVAESAAPCV